MMSSQLPSAQTACPIREAFKKFKQKQNPLEFHDIIDVDRELPSELVEVRSSNQDEIASKVFTVRDKPGFFFIRRALCVEDQKVLFKQCLLKFPRQCGVQHSNLQIDGEQLQNAINLAFSGAENDARGNELVSQRKKGVKASNVQPSRSSPAPDDILLKLRWITMGVHYDWTSKLYEVTNSSTRRLPPELTGLYSRVAQLCNLDRSCEEASYCGRQTNQSSSPACDQQSGSGSLSPDTAIVNLYRAGDTIAVHDDHSEPCKAPLISVSCGLPALFLVGTPKLDGESVQCLLVRSGDCVVLSGEQRLAFHAVPRVFSLEAARDLLSEDETHFFSNAHTCSPIEEDSDSIDAERLAAFINKTRINISIRQVYATGV